MVRIATLSEGTQEAHGEHSLYRDWYESMANTFSCRNDVIGRIRGHCIEALSCVASRIVLEIQVSSDYSWVSRDYRVSPRATLLYCCPLCCLLRYCLFCYWKGPLFRPLSCRYHSITVEATRRSRTYPYNIPGPNMDSMSKGPVRQTLLC